MKTMSPPESRMHEVNTSNSSSDEENDKQEFKEMTDQLKRKFHESDSRSEKVKILTVLLPSWGVWRTAENTKHQTGWQGQLKIYSRCMEYFHLPNLSPVTQGYLSL
jgi:L-rhamnose isomerase